MSEFDSIRQLIEAWQRDAVAKPALYRGLMGHPDWTVAGRREGAGLSLGILRPEGGGRILEIFSDAESISTCEASTGEPLTGERLRLAGHVIFGALGDEIVDKINIDPQSLHTCHFLRDQLPMLRQWAHTVELELALAEPDRVADPIGTLSRFEGYHTVVLPDDDGTYDVVLAPDDRGRALAAIFTSSDLAEAFVARAQIDGEPAVWRQSAGELFGQLRVMAVEGLVFNPWTSLRPVALSAGLIDGVLDRIKENP